MISTWMMAAGIVTALTGAALRISQGGTPTNAAPITNAASAPAPKAPPVWHCCSDIDKAVLWAISFKTYGPDDAEWGRVTTADLDQERTNVEALRVWAEQLDDGDVKNAYLGWCAHFTKTIADTEIELRTHARRLARDEETQRRSQVLAVIPKMPEAALR